MMRLFRSSLGLKYLMAITGLMLFGFVIGHLVGNLLVFAGPDKLNAYGQGLKDLPFNLLWIVRGGLVSVFIVHIAIAMRLSGDNSSARPVGYAKGKTIQATMASRSMLYSGLTVFFFVAFHLAHFTGHLVFNTNAGVDAEGRFNIYRMVVEGFQNPMVAGIYIAAMLVLGMHLKHGIASVIQTMGWAGRESYSWMATLGTALAWLIALANISIPVAIQLGMITLGANS